MIQIAFLEEAQQEYLEAISYYEEDRPELGREFILAVEASMDRLREFPEAGPIIESDDIRRYRLERFPYGVVYVLRGDLIIIVAMMHLHRRPAYWRARWK